MEMVNHPKHYQREGRKECIEEISDCGEDLAIIFCITNAYKYVYRAGLKDSEDVDMQKAVWYINKAGEYSTFHILIELSSALRDLFDKVTSEIDWYYGTKSKEDSL